MSRPPARPHHVVIVGSGFGGLFAAKEFAGRKDVLVTLLAKTDHHLFQPLLYQVATGILSPGEIAPATREVFRRQRNVRVLQGLVEGIDVGRRVVRSRFHEHVSEVPYDSLVVAAGAGQSYFGNDRFATFAPGMKSIDDALELRSRIFGVFEAAEVETDEEVRRRLLTFVVVGAGPTGVEMAGQIRELSSNTLAEDFRMIDPRAARVILVDGADQVLPAFGDRLGHASRRALEELGIEVRLQQIVTDIDESGIVVEGRDGRSERIPCTCKVWAAGVQASDLGQTLADQTGSGLDRAGRVEVADDLTLPGHPEVFVVGDMMSKDGVPGVAQGAIQSGQYAARAICAGLDGQRPGDREPFSYWDKGSMAIISKYRGVASVGPLRITGFPAWLAWLGVHLVYLVGFKSRISTLLRWAITFVGNQRAERVTTNQQLVGRLAMGRLGQHVTGPLLEGADVAVGREPRRHE